MKKTMNLSPPISNFEKGSEYCCSWYRVFTKHGNFWDKIDISLNELKINNNYINAEPIEDVDEYGCIGSSTSSEIQRLRWIFLADKRLKESTVVTFRTFSIEQSQYSISFQNFDGLAKVMCRLSTLYIVKLSFSVLDF